MLDGWALRYGAVQRYKNSSHAPFSNQFQA